MGPLGGVRARDSGLAALMCAVFLGYWYLIDAVYEPQASTQGTGGLGIEFDLTPLFYLAAGAPVLYVCWALLLRRWKRPLAWWTPALVTVLAWLLYGVLPYQWTLGGLIFVPLFGLAGAGCSMISSSTADPE